MSEMDEITVEEDIPVVVEDLPVVVQSPRRAKPVEAREAICVVPSDVGNELTFQWPDNTNDTPVRWQVEGQGDAREGQSLTMRVAPWFAGPRRWLGQVVPRVFTVMVEGAEGSLQRVEVRVYPADRLSIALDALQYASFAEAFSEVNHALGCFIEGWHARVLEGGCKLEAGWEECEDHQAFYRWELMVGFDPLLGVSGRYSLGPLSMLPAFMRNHLLDAGVFVDAIGKITSLGSVGRFTPGMLSGALTTYGAIEFGMGISAHVLQRVAMVEFRGKTSLIAAASVVDPGNGEPMLGMQVSWDGIRGDATIKLVGGLIFTAQVTVADPEVLCQRSFPLPLERMLGPGEATVAT